MNREETKGKKKVYGTLICLFLCLLLLVTQGVTVFAKQKEEKKSKAATTYLVKYKDSDKNTETKLKNKQKEKKVKGYQKLKGKNLYSVTLEDGISADLLKDAGVELLEEDVLVSSLHDEFGFPELGEDGYLEPGEDDFHESEETVFTEGEEFTEEVTFEEGELLFPELFAGGLSAGTASVYSPTGEELTWNLQRIRAHELLENGITGKGIKIAVLDTGIDLKNSELKVAGGVSFVEGVSSYQDDNGHGTAMAGIVASQINGKGITGIAPDVSLYSVKVLDKNGQGRYSSVIAGLDWAIENGIDIIALSLGGEGYSKILEEAIERAAAHNILIIAASGNTGTEGVLYPAAFSQVVCVGATNEQNEIASFSTFGEGMRLVAPGEDILTTGQNNTFVKVSGTSAAVPHIAGVAALLWSQDTDLTNGQLKYLLYYNTLAVSDTLHGGYGLVDAARAYEMLLQEDYSFEIVDEDGHTKKVYGDVSVGGDGIISGLGTDCGCKGCYQSSSYYNYAEHSNGGHRRVYYCGLSSCYSKHSYTCVYATSTYDKSSSCCSCGNHSYGAYTTVNATCTAAGSKTRSCSKCGAKETTTIAKTAHTAGSWVTTVTATCTKTGTQTQSCTACKAVMSTKSTALAAHSYTKWVITKQNYCITDGLQVLCCSVCSTEGTQTQVLPAKGHLWDSGAVTRTATCSLEGVKTFTCQRNTTHTSTESIAKTAHKLVSETTKSPTCSTTGVRSQVCSVCRTVSSQTTLAKDPSNHDNYNVNSSAYVCTGSQHRFIGYCGCGNDYIYLGYYSPCNCHYHSYYQYYGGHTTSGHTIYYQCSGCSSSYSSGTTTLSSCLSCTTPPTAYVSGLTDGAVFSEIDTAYTLRISVQDNENDALTCKAYLDGAASPFSTMTVNGTSSVKEAAFPNTINMASLSEGTHTIRLEVKDAIAPVRSVSITFRVDKTAPVITGCVSEEAERQIALQIAATDAVAGIESYRFTFGGVTGTWSSSPETSFDELIPNTVYSYGVSVKDTAGHITSQTGTVATKAEKPLVGKKAAEMDSMEIQIKDGNAAGTEYVIHVGDFYADGNGMLSANPVPLVLTGDADGMKLFTVHGLNDNTEYAVLVCAKGKRGSADDIWSNIIQIKTKKAPVIRPAMANAVVSGSAVGQTKTVLSWEEIEGATGYDVEADGTVYAVGTSLSFEHAGLSEGSSHTYRVRGRNSYVKGAWSETMLLTTSPQTPAVPDGIFAVIQEDRLFVSWNGAEDVLSYDIEVNGTVYEDAGAMAYQQAITKEEAEAGFLIRVRGKNAGGISDWSAPVSVLPSEEPPVIPSLGEILLTKQERGSDYLLFLWKPAEGAFSYEVTLNGQTVQRGHQPMAYLGSLTPDVQYTVIIKALGAEGSTEKEIVLTTLGVNEEGSEPNQPLPDRSLSMVQEAIKNTHTGEKIKIVVPVTNLAPGRYQAVISFDKSEAVLYDACGVTSVRELGSCYLEHKKQQIIVEERDGRIYVTTIFETKKKVKEMTAAHVVLKSKGSSVTIHYEM